MSTDPNTPASDPVDPVDPGAVKPFAAFVQEQRNGNLHSELSERLQELVAAVMEHERAGSLTLTIKVAPAGNALNLIVSDDVKLKAPEPERPVALWFADSHGNVSRRNPAQPELPLREIADTRKAG